MNVYSLMSSNTSFDECFIMSRVLYWQATLRTHAHRQSPETIHSKQLSGWSCWKVERN